ncbi:hypothetical protein MMC18_006854 [Xylographa bjoerkii]|nr:hypothetical protein [Xylographa bjoerkii]
MAFGFGVGDILLLTNMIAKTIGDIHTAPKELRELADRVESVEISLQSINELAHDQTAIELQNLQNVARLKERVRKVLVELHDVVVKYRDNEGRVNSFNRVKYGIWDKRGVEGLMVKLKERTDDLTTYLIIQIWRSSNQIRPLVDRVLAHACQREGYLKVSSPVQNANIGRRPHSNKDVDLKAAVSDLVDQVQAAMKHVLQAEQPSDPTLMPDQENVSIERELETQLGLAGVSAAVISTLVEGISEQRNQLAHPEDFDPVSYTGGKRPMEVPKGWIMVVDSYNEVRSIIAQIYLELFRVWTVNNSDEWLFNRVESAGIQVETDFSRQSLRSQSRPLVKGGNAPESAALRAAAGKESFLQSEEKNDILARVAKHRSRGIDYWHFRHYEYMLCFDSSVYEALTALAECCKTRYTKIILLGDIRLKDAAATLHVDETTKLVNSIKDGITSFLRQEYHWERPPLPMKDGPFRTKQIVLPRINTRLDPSDKEVKLNEISLRTDCRIRVTDERFDSQLLSITGRREAVPFAVSLLRETLA